MPSNLSKLHLKLKNILSPNQILLTPQAKATYLQEQRGNFTSEAYLVVLPTTVIQVSQILKLCNNLNIGVVPLSGNTGLVGGGVSSREQIIISLQQMNNLRDLDIINRTITLEAGYKLNHAQDVCLQNNLVFPLDLPSREAALIGGNLATNAGGLNTVKYGQVKNFTLGLEVVLANGHIISDLNKLSKRNIGPDYKNIFIGSEGVLGVITAATFKVYPLPAQNINILLSTSHPKSLCDIFLQFQEVFCGQISAFEVMNQTAVAIPLNVFNCFFPLNRHAPWYVLISLDYYTTSKANTTTVYNILQQLQQEGIILQYFMETSTKKLWEFRDFIPPAQTLWGASIKYDIAIPLSHNATFINHTIQAVHSAIPIAVPVIFGHLGDQSLHFNFTFPYGFNISKQHLKQYKTTIDNIMYNLVMDYQGNFCAEHGVGLLHKDKIKRYYFDNQYYMVKLLKSTFDPNNILNPNKLIELTN